MHLDHVEAIHLIQQIGVLLRSHDHDHVDVMVLPPAVDLRSVTSVVEADRLPLRIGAQHVSQHDRGAYTGEIATSMLCRLGVGAVLVGHSERRQYFAMTNDVVSATLQTVQRSGLTALLCVGEPETVRASDDQDLFVTEQVHTALAGATEQPLVVAYEPVWAIGSGATATVEQIAAMVAVIRAALPEPHRETTPILYGGSIRADNTAEIARSGQVNGFLVGGASIRAEEFVAIVSAANDCYGRYR
jgi:triosephosphate isomerase